MRLWRLHEERKELENDLCRVTMTRRHDTDDQDVTPAAEGQEAKVVPKTEAMLPGAMGSAGCKASAIDNGHAAGLAEVS